MILPAFLILSVSSWLWPVVIVAYIAAIIAVIYIIVTDNGNPTRSLAWVAVVVLLPVIGILLYVFLGHGLKGIRTISRRGRRKLLKQEELTPPPKIRGHLSPQSCHLIKIGHATSGAPYYPDTSVTLFNDGESFFRSLIIDLEAATSHINMQYYIFADDNIGRRIADILIDKARNGLKVRLMYDYVGCIDVPKDFFSRMADAGVEVEPFFKVAFPKFATTLNWRNHRKAVIIDSRIGYIGGMNVADRYINGGDSFGHWRDTSVRFTGPAVAGLQYNFAIDWNFMGGGIISDNVVDEPVDTVDAVKDVGVQLVTGGPTSRYSGIALTFFRAIAMAEKRVWIQTPYFLPNSPLLGVLQSAALSGVDVRIMLPRINDSRLLAYASRSYITECLGAGIKFYFYEPGMLHCKVLVIDHEFSTIGSANFDYRSLEHNFEENIMMYSTEMNRLIAESFEADMARCTKVIARKWYRRPRHLKIIESVSRLLSPIL
ncbi:MAG: cardiolipin synthase [Lachnoclostridium sp.]|nr:cardiolipin synthase [Lachnoclostridium sp.]